MTHSGKTTVYETIREMYPDIIPLKIDTTLPMSDELFNQITYNSVSKENFKQNLYNDEYFIYKTYAGNRKKDIEYYGFKRDALKLGQKYIVDIPLPDVSTFIDFYKGEIPILVFNCACSRKYMKEMMTSQPFYFDEITKLENYQNTFSLEEMNKRIFSRKIPDEPFDDFVFDKIYHEEKKRISKAKKYFSSLNDETVKEILVRPSELSPDINRTFKSEIFHTSYFRALSLQTGEISIIGERDLEFDEFLCTINNDFTKDSPYDRLTADSNIEKGFYRNETATGVEVTNRVNDRRYAPLNEIKIFDRELFKQLFRETYKKEIDIFGINAEIKIENPNNTMGIFDFLAEDYVPESKKPQVTENIFDFELTGELKKEVEFKIEHPYLEYGEPNCCDEKEVGEDMESKWFE